MIGGIGSGASSFHSRRASLSCGSGLIVLLLRNLLLLDELFVASKVVLRFYIVRLGLLQLRLRCLELLLCRLDASAGAGHIRLASGYLAVGVDGCDRDRNSRCGSRRLGIGKIRLRALVGHLVVGSIDLDEHGSRLHVLVVLDVELDHMP